jgi:hypothetical protein
VREILQSLELFGEISQPLARFGLIATGPQARRSGKDPAVS